MKILTLTDIHEDYLSARNACMIEKPDLVLDCGDHHEIVNIAELVPHFYIFGNHEPSRISLTGDSMPLPNKINAGEIIQFEHRGERVTFSGLDGNYSNKGFVYAVSNRNVDLMGTIPAQGINILLLHESPLNKNARAEHGLAKRVVYEIERIKPKIVFCGHSGIYSDILTQDEKIRIVNLDDSRHGYGILTVKGDEFEFERKILRHK